MTLRRLPRTHRLAAAWAIIWLAVRRLRSEPLLPLLVVVTVGVSAGILAAAPRLANRAADDEVHAALRDASPSQRNLQMSGIDAINSVQDLDERSARVRSVLEPPLRAVIARSDWVALTPRFIADPPTATAYRDKPVQLVLAIRSGIAAQVAMVKGALPGTERCNCTFGPENLNPPPIPVAVSQPTAAFLGWKLGDVVPLAVDSSDPFAFAILAVPMRATIVGIFTVPQPSAEYWFADTRLANVIDTRPDGGGVIIGAALI